MVEAPPAADPFASRNGSGIGAALFAENRFHIRGLTDRASARPRQQRRPGAACAEEENAARRRVPRDEAEESLREAVGEAGARARRGDPPGAQAGAQTGPARGVAVDL